MSKEFFVTTVMKEALRRFEMTGFADDREEMKEADLDDLGDEE